MDRERAGICEGRANGLFRIECHAAAGYNLSYKLPARDASGQMGNHEVASLGGNLTIYESSDVFAAQVRGLFLVSAFVRHARSLRSVLTSYLTTVNLLSYRNLLI
jgi:hypothetical protein